MKSVVAAALVAAVSAAGVEPPVFPTQWSAYEVAYNIQNGEIVQTTHVNSCWDIYTQGGNQTGRIAYQATDGGTGQIFDFTQNLVYVGAAGYCQYICDIDMDPCDAEDSLCAYGFAQAKNNGTTVIDGQKVEAWTWSEGIPGRNPHMDLLILYTAVDTKVPTPVQMVRVLQPYGQVIGTYQNNFEKYTVGVPPAECFVQQNMQYCPYGDPDSQCGDSTSQARALKHAVHNLVSVAAKKKLGFDIHSQR